MARSVQLSALLGMGDIMRGGTYARALEAGFTPEQAAFFAHLSIDTFNEAVQEITKHEQEKLHEDGAVKHYTVLEMIVIFVLGIALGFAF
jgi:hypothetical protein